MKSPASASIFDIAIIGGGIAGAAIARDAALRRVSVILFEKNTFGSGTSSKSSKLIHGGLRYLEVAWHHLLLGHWREFLKNFFFVRAALKETHILHQLAPDLVYPIKLLVPIYDKKGHHPLAAYFGIVIYGLLSRFSGGKQLPQILHSKQKVLEKIPLLNPEGLQGGILIWDHTTDDGALVHKVMKSAMEHGLTAYEHAEVTHYHFHLARRAYEIHVSVNGTHEVFYARKLINAAGPWVDKVRERGHERKQDFIVPVAGSHIHLKKFCETSVILEAADQRIFFVINQNDEARIGTTERVHFNPDQIETTEEEIRYLLNALKKYFPSVSFRREDVLKHDAGIRPLAKPQNATSPHEISREHQIVTGPTGVLHVLGVKLTDHRRAAKEVVDKLIPEIRKWNPGVRQESLTAKTPL